MEIILVARNDGHARLRKAGRDKAEKSTRPVLAERAIFMSGTFVVFVFLCDGRSIFRTMNIYDIR